MTKTTSPRKRVRVSDLRATIRQKDADIHRLAQGNSSKDDKIATLEAEIRSLKFAASRSQKKIEDLESGETHKALARRAEAEAERSTRLAEDLSGTKNRLDLCLRQLTHLVSRIPPKDEAQEAVDHHRQLLDRVKELEGLVEKLRDANIQLVRDNANGVELQQKREEAARLLKGTEVLSKQVNSLQNMNRELENKLKEYELGVSKELEMMSALARSRGEHLRRFLDAVEGVRTGMRRETQLLGLATPEKKVGHS